MLNVHRVRSFIFRTALTGKNVSLVSFCGQEARAKKAFVEQS